VMFGKHSYGIPFTAGLDPDTASLLQLAADSVTFGYVAQWNIGNDVPEVAFTAAVSADTLFTQNSSTGAVSWYWDFGDGQTSTLFEPFHVYASAGSFPVKLKGCNTCFCDSAARQVVITTVATRPPPAASGTISLAGPDDSGHTRLINYSGDGTLFFYSAAGKLTATCPVHSGQASGPALPGGIWLWTLYGEDAKVIAGGKIAR
jgi:PKD repeat protein